MRLTVNDVSLNVNIVGAGQPLVLLHGFTGCAANWRAHTTAFASHYRTIAIDLLGHGQSAWPTDPARYRMEHCVADLLAVFDQLKLGQINLLGYSMGGRVALHFAAAHPERISTLILESASPGLAEATEREARRQNDEALADFIEHAGLAAFVDRWENLPLFASQSRLSEAVRAELRAQRLRNTSLGLANSLRGLGLGVQSPLWEILPNLSFPTLLITGDLDSKFTNIAHAMAQAMPQARLTIVPNAGHTVHLEQPAPFNRLILDELSKIAHPISNPPIL